MKKRIKIEQSDYTENPRREWDNLGTMVCFHKRYDLGDKHQLRSNDFDSWQELEKHLIKKMGAVVILPLYLYDHGGITMSTGPFDCPWDSGQVGFIYVNRETLQKEYGVKKVTQKFKEKIIEYLISEVKTYDQYLTGDVYEFTIESAIEMVKLSREDFNAGKFENVDDEIEWELEDSCGGFYGLSIDNGIYDHADATKEAIQLALDSLGEWIEYEIE